MPSWILGPIDRRSEIWNIYPVRRIVIEAHAEWEAREKVAEVAPELQAPNPWLDAGQTTCEQITPPDMLAPPPWISPGATPEARSPL
jgi:hypothetical protein